MNDIIKPFGVTAFLVLMTGVLQAQIQISTRYPGYWEYNGEPTLLIGAWDHGHNPFLDHSTRDGLKFVGGQTPSSVLDDSKTDKDRYEDTSTKAEIIAALDDLAAAGGNLLRCVLDPGTGAGNQGFSFCVKRGNLYDLDKMKGTYWKRLKFFLKQAQKRKIIVGIEIWDRFDWYDAGYQGWPNSPFNPKNNINYTSETTGLSHSYEGKGDKSENPFGLTTPGQTPYKKATKEQKAKFDLIRRYQEKFIDKLLSVTFLYDNVLYSANNEVRHQEPAWGEYWIDYIKNTAAEQGKEVICTDMFWDIIDIPQSSGFDHLMANAHAYDYFDISQTSAQRNKRSDTPREVGQRHWAMVSHAAEKAKSVNRLLHMNKIYGSSSRTGGWMGSEDNAVEEFWRSLIAGVAGVRFHRPESGLGLSEKSKNCLKAVRLAEQKVKLWEVESFQELLSGVDLDEAYLAANPGEKYILFFTDGGSVGIDMTNYPDKDFEISWISVDTGEPGGDKIFQGGQMKEINAPSGGHWIAVIIAEKK